MEDASVNPDLLDASALSSSSSMLSSTSILSCKVHRAMQIRTDTPAMKAALEALGQLSEGNHHRGSTPSNNKDKCINSRHSTTDFSLDARSVRHAIEYDALQQAVLLRNELRSLCSQLREMRQGISETAHMAHQVKLAIHTNVVVEHNKNVVLNNNASSELLLASGSSSSTTTQQQLLPKTAQEDEEHLAATLAEAFAKRNLARERLSAVHQFFETFDLSEQDSRLLDHYNFEDLDLFSNNNNNNNYDQFIHGSAFLQALERVKDIRQALTKTFGKNTATTTSSSSALSSSLQLLEGTVGTSSGGGVSSLGTSSALRMMEHLAQKQEQAYERLYHWLQSHLQLYSSSSSSGGGGGGQPPKKLSDGSNSDPNHSSEHDTMDQALQHPFVQAALHTLRHVPAFYRHMLELIASRRRQEETRIFLLALTSGYGGLPPLERLSHDSVAYVGDILAFAFRSLSTEADMALTIVHYQHRQDDENNNNNNNDDGRENETETQQAKNNDENKTAEAHHQQHVFDYGEKPLTASDLLSTSLSGMARPVKSRIVQVITTLSSRVDGDSDAESDDGMLDEFEEEGAIVRNKLAHLYDICGLLLFYLSAMEKTVRKIAKQDAKQGLFSQDEQDEIVATNSLFVNITACLTEAVKALEATVRVYSAMMGTLSGSTGESVASLAKALLVRIAEVRQTSPGFAQDVPCPSKECEMTLSTTWIATQVVEAALPYCNVLDDTVTMKSAIRAVKRAGMDVMAAQRLDELVDGTESILVEKLVEEESYKVLQLCGLGKLVVDWEKWKLLQKNQTSFSENDEPTAACMSAQLGLSNETVMTAMKEFYASLYSPPLPSLELVIRENRALRKQARSHIANKVCERYEDLYRDLVETSAGYDTSVLALLLEHDPAQVKTLLSA